ncbi:MAG: alkaline phosphatase family protein [Thermoplasmata archaeon]|nr:alkaline phosphatase family protein [Thermoplasmata archaeon]
MPVRRSSPARRLLVIGLDGVPPEFLFDRMLPVMPNVRSLVARGMRAPLRTTDPPISVPAWPVMFTGVDPGTLGLYGFRHRRRKSYTEMTLPKSTDVPVPTVWELLSQRGHRVAVVGMPLGFPAPSVNGVYISDFLTPPNSEGTTYPDSLRAEIDREFGRYQFDVTFRSGDLEKVARDIFEMTVRRFRVAESLFAREEWDLFALHEVGTDRLHHAFWKHFDLGHPEFRPGNPFEHIAEEYYALVDEGIGRLLRIADDRADVMIVSDHGSMAMRGCFCINQWLEEKGYIVLKRPPERPGTPFEQVDVDWNRTTIWGAGGYYARLFFNLQGRELSGTLTPPQAEDLRERVVGELGEIEDPDGAPLPVQVLDPRDLYASVTGEAPDLMLYFDDLRVRSAGTMGHPSMYLQENDVGADDAVHSRHGVFLYRPAQGTQATILAPFPLIDIAPTILQLLGEEMPTHMQGRAVRAVIESSGRRSPMTTAA